MRSLSTLAAVLALLGTFASCQGATAPACPAPIDGATLAKFVDPLPSPGSYPDRRVLTIGMHVIQQPLHRDLPPTTLYGYGVTPMSATYPGPTIRATQGQSLSVLWFNRLGKGPHLLPVDATIDQAIPRIAGVPTVVHVHGGEVAPDSDGNPLSWFTFNFGDTGPGFVNNKFEYPNTQQPATIWYHDHALGTTRLNVYAGLAGLYIIDDGVDRGLPSGDYDVPLLIQDRALCPNGALYYPIRPFRNSALGETSVPSIWVPEFFGNLVVVNGKVWPFKEVERRTYRFRVADGSNARFYNLYLEDNGITGGPSCAVIYQIATDGGYLDAPVLITPPFLMAPGERRELVVDFSGCAEGTIIDVRNNAAAPFAGPEDFTNDLGDVSYILQFRVLPGVAAPSFDPASVNLRGSLPAFPQVDVYRTMTLTEQLAVNELTGEEVPIELQLNRLGFLDATTEFPNEGDTEEWDFIKLVHWVLWAPNECFWDPEGEGFHSLSLFSFPGCSLIPQYKGFLLRLIQREGFLFTCVPCMPGGLRLPPSPPPAFVSCP
eukprot:jgi/Mesvir1/16907/Mv25088-RA.3